MSFWDSVKRFTQPYSDEEYEYEEETEGEEEDVEQEAAPRSRRPSPFGGSGEESGTYTPASGSSGGFSVSMNSNKQEVVLFHAKTFDDAAKAADELRRKKAVILNMENIDKALTRRVVDFLSGSVYALDGSVKKIAQSTYLFCPHKMDVVGDLENIQGEIESYI
ncbi:MAG: cell division protein SepF [Oscillospiraceae bacterium]|nr:cell division protein SepF [Oscillospiraceae bacterium]